MCRPNHLTKIDSACKVSQKITTKAVESSSKEVNTRKKSPANRNTKTKPKQRKRSLPKNLKIGQNLTPPPGNTLDSTKAIHSAETPATISKLKRKRRRNVGFVGPQHNTRVEDNTNHEPAAASDEKKQKISASQEVDRVFDFLGLPEYEQQQQFQSTQPIEHTTGSALKSAIEAVARTSISPIPSSRLFEAHGATKGRSVKQTEPIPPKERQKLKLPPLRPNRHAHTEKENVVNRNEINDVEDLFKEVEMGLNQARGDGSQCESAVNMSKVTAANATAVTASTLTSAGIDHSCADKSNNVLRGQISRLGTSQTLFKSNHQNMPNPKTIAAAPKEGPSRGVHGALLPGTKGNINSTPTTMSADVSSSNCVDLPCAKPHQPQVNSVTASSAPKHIVKPAIKSNHSASIDGCLANPTSINRVHPPTSNPQDDEFSDDDWNEEDFAAIDKCIAMTQCQVSENLLKENEFDSCLDDDLAAIDIPPLAAKRSSNIHDEFGDDDDDELAALDLSATMTQPNATILNSFESNFCGVAKPATVSNIPSVNTSEFSDDDDDELAGLDFSAISSASLPSKHVPTHNRRSNVANNRLGFTRYVIRSVEENVVACTKTIGVSLWSVDEAKSRGTDEMECLKKYQENDSSNVNAVKSVNGYIHLRGIWYYTKCCVGDVFHLISISGQYATDSTALPIVLDSIHAPSGSCDQDDLVLVIHPDEMITPTLISEAVTCPRLSVLQQRLGSTGLSARSAVIGTLRHGLFERCLQEHTASRQSAAVFTRQIIRDNAESLVGCGITDQKDAFTEVMKTLPQIQVSYRCCCIIEQYLLLLHLMTLSRLSLA